MEIYLQLRNVIHIIEYLVHFLTFILQSLVYTTILSNLLIIFYTELVSWYFKYFITKTGVTVSKTAEKTNYVKFQGVVKSNIMITMYYNNYNCTAQVS